MENNLTSSEVAEQLIKITNSITDSLTFFTGFNIKRKYRNRKFKFYHKKGIIEENPLISVALPIFSIKMLRRLIRKKVLI